MMAIVLIGCSKDELALGKYKDREYVNDNFKLKLDIPKEFSFLTEDELLKLNSMALAESQNPEMTKFRNMVLNVEHIDGTKLVAFVDASPIENKNKAVEANNYLNYLSAQDVDYTFEKEENKINNVSYLLMDLELPFDKAQRNYIAVRNDKLINVQINYDKENKETAEVLFSLYE